MMRAGLIGGRLGHSFSPQIHEAYGRLVGQDIRYTLHETDAHGLEALLAKLQSEGYAGVNVTMPHKKAVMPLLDEISPEAEAIGAVNTVRFEGTRRTGHNTDYFGLGWMLKRAGISLAGQSVVILGSGGAARCAAALAKDGGARVTVLSRNPQDADPALDAVGYDALDGLQSIGVLVNTTPAGMVPDIDGCPVTPDVLARCGAVADIVYNPPETRLVQRAAARGIRCAEGLPMLVAQALRAEQLWTGIPFGDAACEAVLETVRAGMRTNIVLTGMPGSGKSAVGRRLAEKLGMGFLDTDARVEAEHGVIADIFAVQGEAAFREMEREAAQYTARRANAVIATGGGIVQTAAAMRALKASGIIVYVDRPLELLLRDTETAHRPLLAGGREALVGLYEKRRALYEGSADIIVKNDKDVAHCVDAIIKALEEYRP